MAKRVLGLRSLIYGKFETEAAFAERLGWTRQRLSKMTNGKKVPNIYEAKELADALGEDIEKIADCFICMASDNEYFEQAGSAAHTL